MTPILNLFTGQTLSSVAMTTPMEFILALKSAHQSQVKWSELEREQRSVLLDSVGQWIQNNQISIAQKLAQVQGLSAEFVLKNEVLPAIESFLQIKNSLARLGNFQQANPEFSPLPLGLIVILLPQYFSFRFLAEKVSEGLLAGNAFFVKTSSLNPMVGEIFAEAFQSLPEKVVHLFHGDHELGQLMARHPAMKGVIMAGKPTSTEKVIRELSGSWKRLQIFSGYHNSALILPDAGSMENIIPQLLESSLRGMGQLTWNIQNVFVLEKDVPEFEKQLVAALKHLKFATSEDSKVLLGPLHAREQERIQNLWNQIKSENGKILYSGEISATPSLQVRPLVVKDLSHCSTLQQDWLGAPVILISPVKYVHDMVKWTNTAYFGQLAQIFGSSEKREKFGRQLEVGSVVGPGGISEIKKWPVGIKQSSMGEMDPWAFGRFFSQYRHIQRP